jgi:hypothetical protein
MNDDRANLTASTHLRSTSLSAWTTQHPASPRRTVHDYLKDQRNHTYPSLALPALASNPAPAFPSSSNNNKSSDSYPRPRASPPEGEGFALVLGREDKENYEAGGTLEVKGKRKVSLVAAMRRRAPSLASHSPADSGRDKRAVSPMLVARVARQEVVEDEEGSIDRILDAALDAGEDLVHNDNGEDDDTSPKRKRASRTRETGKHATKGGATKDAGSDAEDQEVIERESSFNQLSIETDEVLCRIGGSKRSSSRKSSHRQGSYPVRSRHGSCCRRQGQEGSTRKA